MHIALIAKPGHENSGVGRYMLQLKKALEKLGHQVSVVHPIVPIPEWVIKMIKKWLGWDLAEFFNNYPVWARYPQADIYHFTSQNLATLLLFCRPPGPNVVTIHDLLPYILNRDGFEKYPNIAAWCFDRIAIHGLQHASTLIADSITTQQYTCNILDVSPKKIPVVLLGIN